MQQDEMRALLARIKKNHQRAHALLEEAHRVVGLAADTMEAIARRQECGRATTVADLREVAQRAREVVQERQELLEKMAKLTGRVL